jgi:ABC-type Fe3+-hydroxamate transport system substrate-binding protein
MCAGNNTFINHLLTMCGLNNVMNAPRYPEISPEKIKALNPELIFLSSEPYPFREKHIAELKEISPLSQIVRVDGEMFSWYGSRLLYAPSYFERLLTHLA